MDGNVIIRGDFNVILNPEVGGMGGNPKLQESVKKIQQMRSSFDLKDIWRIRKTDVKQFTWRQKNPVVYRRLDFWSISSSSLDDIEGLDSIPAVRFST